MNGNRMENSARKAIWMFALLLWGSCYANAQQAASSPQAPPAQASQPDTAGKKSEVRDSELESYHLPRTPEDFGRITLVKNELVPEAPLRLSYAEHEKFIFERVRVKWRNYDPIDLYVVKPTGVAKPPVILYLYGYPAGVDGFKNDRWLERVTDGGFAAVGFLPALTKDRFQMRPMKQTFLTELPESIATTVHDVQMILNYLQTRGDLDMENVGLLGNGSGATIAILSAAADPRIKAIDLMEPWGDWPDWAAHSNALEKGEREPLLRPELQAKLVPLDPLKWLPQLTSQKIMLQFIDTDDEMNKAAKAKIEAAAPGNATVNHFPSRMQHVAASADGRRFAWLRSQLRPAKSEQTSSQNQK